jgi:hypothetical protein
MYVLFVKIQYSMLVNHRREEKKNNESQNKFNPQDTGENGKG